MQRAPGVRERLKQATRDVHDRVEAAVGLLDPAAQVSDYRRFLERMLGFLEPFAAALRDAHGEDVAGFPTAAGPRLEALRQDLLGLGHDAASLGALPRCQRLPAFDAPARALGALYVVEGSALGGRVLHRELARRWPDVVAQASAFIRAEGQDTLGRWRELVRRLELVGERPRAAEAMLAGSRETFAALEDWLAP